MKNTKINLNLSGSPVTEAEAKILMSLQCPLPPLLPLRRPLLLRLPRHRQELQLLGPLLGLPRGLTLRPLTRRIPMLHTMVVLIRMLRTAATLRICKCVCSPSSIHPARFSIDS